jgi:hypothetical protein
MSERKVCVLQVRLTEAQHQRVRELAARRNETVSTLVRRMMKPVLQKQEVKDDKE